VLMLQIGLGWWSCRQGERRRCMQRVLCLAEEWIPRFGWFIQWNACGTVGTVELWLRMHRAMGMVQTQ